MCDIHVNYFIEKATLIFPFLNFENVDFSQYCLVWQKYSPEDFCRTFAWHSPFVDEEGCPCHLVNLLPLFYEFSSKFCSHYMLGLSTQTVFAPNRSLKYMTVLIIWSLLLFSSKVALEKRELGGGVVGFCSEMELQWWRRWREGGGEW